MGLMMGKTMGNARIFFDIASCRDGWGQEGGGKGGSVRSGWSTPRGARPGQPAFSRWTFFRSSATMHGAIERQDRSPSMSFNVDQIDLSMTDPTTGLYLTANVYYVDGVTDATDAPRPLSIGQLVMAICLQRAAELETQIVSMMETMNLTSAQLEAMTEIETEVVKWPDELVAAGNVARSLNNYRISSDNAAYPNKTYREALVDMGVIADGIKYVRVSGTPDAEDIMYDDFINALESKMDEKNSFSQQTMIELQSLTNKRDQSYDMISNILKSLNTVMTGIVNNT